MWEPAVHGGLFKKFCYSVLAHPTFDVVMGTVIVVNSISIGVELTVQPSEENETPEARLVFGILENLFLSIYVVELACRIYGCGAQCLRNPWVKFDLVLVVTGVIGAWLLPIATFVIGDALTQFVPSTLFLRAFRLARVARALRLFVQFRTLWMLVSGFSSSLTTIMNVFIVLLVTLFVFSCVGVELIAKHPKSSEEGDFKENVERYWNTLPKIMMTLVQFITLDNASGIYTPMIHDDVWLVFFFLPFLLVVSIILMNLITAVIIDAFLENSKRDQETRRLWNEQRMHQLRPQLRNIFQALDADDSGLVSLDELKDAPREVQNELATILNVDSLSDLFHALDADGSNEVSIEEFFEGMAWLICNNHALDITRNLALLRLIKRDLEELKDYMKSAVSASPGQDFVPVHMTPLTTPR